NDGHTTGTRSSYREQTPPRSWWAAQANWRGATMITARLALAGTLLLAGALSGTDPARADAALAVGQPPDVARDGLAVGWAVGYARRGAAEREAPGPGRESGAPPPATLEACRVVEAFSDRCLAVALDPDSGTTGVGWAVHRNRDWAEDMALERCAEASAPK